MSTLFSAEDLVAARLVEQLGFAPTPATSAEGLAELARIAGQPVDTPAQREAIYAALVRGLTLWREWPEEVAAALQRTACTGRLAR